MHSPQTNEKQHGKERHENRHVGIFAEQERVGAIRNKPGNVGRLPINILRIACGGRITKNRSKTIKKRYFSTISVPVLLRYLEFFHLPANVHAIRLRETTGRHALWPCHWRTTAQRPVPAPRTKGQSQ